MRSRPEWWIHRGCGMGLGPERFEKMRHSYESASALDTLVSPEDVAETIYYLGAVASRTTGEVHVVDGGRRLGRL